MYLKCTKNLTGQQKCSVFRWLINSEWDKKISNNEEKSYICSLSRMHACMHTRTLPLETHHGKSTLDIYNCCQVIGWIFGAYLTSKRKPWFSNVFIMLTSYLIVLCWKVSSSVAGSIGKGHTNRSSWWTSVVWISIMRNLRTHTDLKCDILVADPICLCNPHPEKRKNLAHSWVTMELNISYETNGNHHYFFQGQYRYIGVKNMLFFFLHASM